MLEFNSYALTFVILLTLGCILWLLKKNKSDRFRIFIILIYCFMFLYNGIGGALIEANPNYLIIYSAYLSVFTIFINVFTSKNRNVQADPNYKNLNNGLDAFINKNAKTIIGIYFFLVAVNLVFPENKLNLLFNPPMPDSSLHLQLDYNHRSGGILYYIKILVCPLYFVALSKYRHKIILLIFYLLIPAYIDYCTSSYIGRNEVLRIILIIFFTLFIDGSPQKRRRLLIASGLAVPVLIIVFYQYSLIRIGGDISSDTFSKIFQTLLNQEITYPLYYDDVWQNLSYSPLSYITWILLCPFPGFMKFGLGEFPMGDVFTTFITGVSRGERGFSILLPGLFNESHIIFGYFFPFHAIILAFIVSSVYNLCAKSKNYDLLLADLCIILAFNTSRAGTGASYPIIIKYLIIIGLLNYFVTCRKRTNILQ